MARRDQLLQDQEVQLRPIDFESFYRQRADGVYRALTSTLRDVDLAQEATAEAMVRTFQHWDKIRRYDNQAGWAYRVGLNWATSRLRRRSRDRTRRSPVGTFGPARPDQPTVFDPELQEALLGLDMPHLRYDRSTR